MKNHPKQLGQELQYLKKVFSNENNGYPIDLILRWFGQFRRDLRAKPEILNVRSRLEFDDIFVLNSQQIFDYPMAAHRFQADISDVDLGDSQLCLENGLMDVDQFRLIDEFPEVHEADASGTRGGIAQDWLLWDVLGEETLPSNNDEMAASSSQATVEQVVPAAASLGAQVPTPAVPGARVPGYSSVMEPAAGVMASARDSLHPLVPTADAEALVQMEPVRPVRKQVLVLPYMPGIGHKLQKIAKQYQFETWFTFPHKLNHLFTQHRGTLLHPSKIQHAVYCVQCTCGVQYVGETERNLKVRLNEHFNNTSCSSLSCRLQQTGHKPTMHDTIILVKERNCLKRKVLESFCIEYKQAHLCNTGVSMDLPAVWNICAENLSRQLKDLD